MHVTGEAGPPHSKQFEYSVVVRGWEFTGVGSTKKAAKASAAEAALQYLHNTVNVGPHGHGELGVGPVKSRAEELGILTVILMHGYIFYVIEMHICSNQPQDLMWQRCLLTEYAC